MYTFRDDYDNVGGVVSDQAEADEDTSLRNRALMAVGKIKQSFETHTHIKPLSIFNLSVNMILLLPSKKQTGSTADGVAGLDQFAFDSDVQRITKDISEAADELKDERTSSTSSTSSSCSNSSNED